MKYPSKPSAAELADKTPAARLSEALNLLMADCGLDGARLSKDTGIPATTINRLRNGDPSNNPTLSTLVPLAAYFSITVSQLIGDEALPESRIRGAYRPSPELMRQLPIISWEQAVTWPNIKKSSHAAIPTEHSYSDHAYALMVEEENWENLSKGTALLIEPESTPEHRDFVIIHRLDQALPSLKQILIDDGLTYLKPVVSGYQITAITPEHSILGIVIEYKKQLKY